MISIYCKIGVPVLSVMLSKNKCLNI
uniref:Uncharacterized protein n=1 Tax=Anguilla anguilla TaxID=7936 RepID=A0A0E9T3G0_ANGAN